MNNVFKNKLFLIFLVFVFICFSFFSFQKIQDEKILINKINKISIFDSDINKIENKINNIQDRISRYQIANKKFFGDGHEAEELYNLLSELAMDNNLLIENISKGKIKKFLRKDIFPQKETSKKNNKDIKEEIVFSKVIVDYRITGKYENYMAFRNYLSQEKVIISVESEEINVDDSKNSTSIEVKLILITYRMGRFDYAKV
jgi:hypothetical protein